MGTWESTPPSTPYFTRRQFAQTVAATAAASLLPARARANVARRRLGLHSDATAGLTNGVGNPSTRAAFLAELRAAREMVAASIAH